MKDVDHTIDWKSLLLPYHCYFEANRDNKIEHFYLVAAPENRRQKESHWLQDQ